MMKIDEMLDSSGQAPVVRCPSCGHEFSHIREVRVTKTTPDGYEVDEVVTVSPGSLHRRSGERGERVNMRQGIIELILDGECQCPPFHITLGEHKGQVFLGWEPTEYKAVSPAVGPGVSGPFARP
ncbi:MAG: hypothetical protein WD939_10125 [Dehalococcoidia bacterium]